MKRFLVRRIFVILVVIAALAAVITVAYLGIRAAMEQSVTFQPAPVISLHDVRTGQPVTDAVDAFGVVGQHILLFYVVYFNPDCPVCQQYTPELIMTWAEMMNKPEYGYRFGIVMIDTGDHSDKELLAYIGEHGIPAGIPVLGGATVGQTGLPEGIEVSEEADMNPPGVPATFLIYRLPEGGWRTVGSRTGVLRPDYLVGIALNYFEWYDAQ